MPPPLIGGGIKWWCCLMSDVCLSVAYIGKERSRKTKIGTEVAHVTRDSGTTFKVKRSRSTGHFTHSGVNVPGSCSGDCGNVLSVGTYCYVAVCRHGRLGGARRFGAHRGRRGAGAYCGGRPPTACSKYFFIGCWTDNSICTLIL